VKQFREDFKAFATRGNVLDLAVAVIIGAAFEMGSARMGQARTGSFAALMRTFSTRWAGTGS